MSQYDLAKITKTDIRSCMLIVRTIYDVFIVSKVHISNFQSSQLPPSSLHFYLSVYLEVYISFWSKFDTLKT